MACRTPSVERVVDKTARAKEQIDKLEGIIKSQEAANKLNFFNQIDEHLASANLSDARQIDYNSYIKTEYTSEFSLDKIAEVVTSSLNAAKALTNPAITNPAISPAAIDAYVNVVNTIAEAAKSSSTAAASVSFSMNRISPGMFAFLFATSMNIQDDETFGKEAVTTTCIFYRLVQSIQDLKLQGEFDAAKIEIELNLQSFRKFKTLQVALIDQLGNNQIDIDTYMKLDALYAKKVEELKSKMGVTREIGPVSMFKAMGKGKGSDVHLKLVKTAIKRLSSMGDRYKGAVETARERIENGYF
jgi:hypothetical protein